MAKFENVSPGWNRQITKDRRKLEAKANGTVLPQGSEIALAMEFAERHAGTIRYVNEWARWFVWNGQRWAEERTLFVYDQCIKLAADAARRGETGAVQIASRKTASAIQDIVRADRRIAAETEQWDSDAWIINTPGIIAHLVGDFTEPANPDYYCTKLTSVAPDPNMPIERWHRFLERVTGGDLELQEYLRRMCGYMLTGDTSEHALFFLWGTGANGKSVFVDTVAGILGDYHRTAPIETFTAAQGERHPTELASLLGARLVTAVETEEGRRWDETKIKVLTGGDRIAARFMRQNFFEYRPQFKLLIAGNHKPGLRSVDEAIRRRFHLIPFTVTIPPEERDPGLTEQLREEWPGILHWMLVGCAAWQARRLLPPPSVVEATKRYLESEDAIMAWIEEECVVGPQYEDTSAALFASWRSWAERCGEHVGQRKRFGQALENRGYEPYRTGRARGFTGIRVNVRAEDDGPNAGRSWSDL